MNPSATQWVSPARAAAVRAWLAETFQGVTWGRFGIFCLILGWNTLASYPTANALFGAAGWGEAATTFLRHFVAYVCTFGPAVLVLVAVGNHVRRTPRGWVWKSALAVAVAALFTIIVGNIFPAVPPPLNTERWDIAGLFNGLFNAMFELGIVGAVILFLARRDQTLAFLHQEEVDRVVVDRELAQARLQVLQSQIEPHFLFNTLANIRWLLQTDRAAGRSMLHEFSQYLEATLAQLRDSQSSLGREVALTCAYLNVQQIRMGKRLATQIHLPDGLKGAAFPPMMLITLVENAIKHGLAPMPQGGNISIAVTGENDRLTVQVIDSGKGLQTPSGPGIGVANTRARLRALFGPSARLTIAQNDGAGVTATIGLPLTFVGPEATRS